MERLRAKDATRVAFYKDFGRSLQAENFVREDFSWLQPLAGLPMYRVRGNEYSGSLYDIARDDNEDTSFQIMEGEQREVIDGEVGYSGEANPCVTILNTTRDGKAYLLHLLGGKLTETELHILRQSTGGIAGGGIELLRQYQHVLERGNIRIYLPEGPQAGFDPFSITVARRTVASDTELRFPAGIYFGYSTIDVSATEE